MSLKTAKVLISGYIGFDNFGDEAILSVLLENLKSQGADITVITANPEKTKLVHGVKTIKTFDMFSIMWAVLNTDILVSGGGSLLQDKTSVKSILYYLFLILFAEICGKKVVIFSQGIGPINSKFARFLTNLAIKGAKLCTVRDEKSLFLLRGWGVEVDLQPDAVFNLKLSENINSTNAIGIQLRDWKTLTDDFLRALANQIVKNFSDRKILLLSLQNNLDYQVLKRLQTYLTMKNPMMETEIVQNNYPQIIPETIQSLEYLIAMRFHACLVGIKAGVKTLAINYDEKVEKLATEAGIPLVNLDEAILLPEKIEELKALNSDQLLEFAATKLYDFSSLNELIAQIEK